MPLKPNVVFCAKAPTTVYEAPHGATFPELPKWAKVSTALISLRALLFEAGLHRSRYGLGDWNPLGDIIAEGDKVVIKPNWVHHYNAGGAGLDCLVTHPSVIEAILHYVAKARPRSIAICDAPIQGCDFAALMTSCGTPQMVQLFAANNVPLTVKDWRCTIREGVALGARNLKHHQPGEEYILYDLGHESLLDAITTAQPDFRVTMYDPDMLNSTHGQGRHQYLIARDAIEADVVLNIPKLKTHKKTCITGALKNMVGMNGHKEYLPHHRKGGSMRRGDCYPGRSRVKDFVEDALDAANRAKRMITRRAFGSMAVAGMAIAKLFGEDNNYDGSWYGNDTAWRMTLDIQRILHFGTCDGTLSNQVQRRILTITDAIIGGQGEGPLSTTPVDLGIMTLGVNAPAVEWAHAVLMGLDPETIPLTREAFAFHRYPLVDFEPRAIVMQMQGKPISSGELFMNYGRRFQVPAGWRGHVERHQSKYGMNIGRDSSEVIEHA